jgi:tellurite resistance protein
MSLFSRRRAGTAETAAPDVARALVAPAYLVMRCDGAVGEAELARLAELCRFSPIIGRLDGGAVEGLLRSVAADFEARGANAVMNEAVDALPPALRETAMAFAIGVALADGDTGEDEQRLLMGLSRHMELPDELTDAIFSVMVILQRPAAA